MCTNEIPAFKMEDPFKLSNPSITGYVNHISNSKKLSATKKAVKNLDNLNKQNLYGPQNYCIKEILAVSQQAATGKKGNGQKALEIWV